MCFNLKKHACLARQSLISGVLWGSFVSLSWQSRDPKQPVKGLKPQVNLQRSETCVLRAAMADLPCRQVTLKLTAVASKGVLEGEMRLKSTATASRSLSAQARLPEELQKLCNQYQKLKLEQAKSQPSNFTSL